MRRRLQTDTLISYWLYNLTFVPLFILIIAVAVQPNVPILFLVHDPITVAELAGDKCCHAYFGLLSNVGVVLWAGASAVCLFAVLVLWVHEGARADWVFLALAGLLTGWFMLDDLFLLHERVLPSLGVPQNLVYVFYGILALAYLLGQWRKILELRFAMLFLAVLLLSMSVLSDVTWKGPSDARLLFEDGSKLLGIGAWVAFHLEAAFVFHGRLILPD